MSLTVHDTGLSDTTGYISLFVIKAQKLSDSPDINPLCTNIALIRNLIQLLKLTAWFPTTRKDVQILPINNN